MIRVGRIRSINDKLLYPDFTTIYVTANNNQYHNLSSSSLKDEKGRIMENIWEFSKVYQSVPKNIQTYSKWNKTIIWDHHEEKHVNIKHKEKGNIHYDILQTYLDWRNKGMNNPYAIRYPATYEYRDKFLFSLPEDDEGLIIPIKLNYVDSRKHIYLRLYSQLVRQQQQFYDLKKRLMNGENLLIVEIDGPHQESLSYYMQRYGVSQCFIMQDSILATYHTLKLLINDTKHPFGYGYCLAATLLGCEYF